MALMLCVPGTAFCQIYSNSLSKKILNPANYSSDQLINNNYTRDNKYNSGNNFSKYDYVYNYPAHESQYDNQVDDYSQSQSYYLKGLFGFGYGAEYQLQNIAHKVNNAIVLSENINIISDNFSEIGGAIGYHINKMLAVEIGYKYTNEEFVSVNSNNIYTPIIGSNVNSKSSVSYNGSVVTNLSFVNSFIGFEIGSGLRVDLLLGVGWVLDMDFSIPITYDSVSSTKLSKTTILNSKNFMMYNLGGSIEYPLAKDFYLFSNLHYIFASGIEFVNSDLTHQTIEGVDYGNMVLNIGFKFLFN